VNQTVQKKLGNWMETNKSKKWSIGCKFVAWLYNTSYHNAVKNLPFVLVFGHQPKVGISNLPIDPNVLNTLATEADLNDIIQVENAPDDVASNERQSVGDLDCVDGGGQLSGSQGGSRGGGSGGGGGGGGGSCGRNNHHSPFTDEEDNDDDNDESVACSSLTAEEDREDNDGFLTVHYHDVKVHFHAAMSQRSMEVPNSLPLCLIFDRYRREEFISTNTNLRFYLTNSGLVADDHCNGVYIDSDCQLSLLNLDIRGEIVFLVYGPQISQPNQLEESERIVGGPLKSQHTLSSGGSTAAAASAKKRTWSVGDEIAAYASGNVLQAEVIEANSDGKKCKLAMDPTPLVNVDHSENKIVGREPPLTVMPPITPAETSSVQPTSKGTAAGVSSLGRARKMRTLLTPSAGVSSRGRQRQMSQVMAESLIQAAKSNHGDDVNEDDSTGSDGSISEYDIDREERRKFTEIYDKTRICRETLKLGDEIQYYDPIGIVGDPNRLCTGIVTCLTPDSDYIVQVNTGDPIHSNRPVKRVRERNSEGDLVAIKRKCRMRTSAEFRCFAGGSATAGITENVRQMTGIIRRTNNMLGMAGVSAVDLRQTPRTNSKQTSKQKQKNVSTVVYIVCVDQSIQESLMIQPSFLQYDSTNNDEDGDSANDDHVNDNVCMYRRRLREAATVNVQKQAAKVFQRLKDNGHANYKLDDVVQVLIPKQDRAKTDRHCLVGVVVEVQEKNSTCRIAVKGGVLDRCIAYHYLKQLPPNSNNVRLHGLETELESWRGLPTMSLRTASRMQSMMGGQGFSKCNCRGKCDNKRCSCQRKGLYCTARCHKGNGKCTNCDTDGNSDNSNNNNEDNNNNNNNTNNNSNINNDCNRNADDRALINDWERQHTGEDQQDRVWRLNDVDNTPDYIIAAYGRMGHIQSTTATTDSNEGHISLSTTARTKTTATTDSEIIANFNIDNLNIDCYPSQLTFHATTNSSNNNDNYFDQSILDLANQYVTAPSNNVEHNQNNAAMQAVANSNVTYLPPQAGKGQLPCPPIWIDNCTTKPAKALQLLKWRGMSQYQQELLCGVALAYEDIEPAVSSS